MSIPVTIDLPEGFRRVAWPGRLGRVAVVAGSPPQPRGSALLIPGFTGSKEDYFATLAPLLQRGWAVAAADLPGMSESDGPSGAEAYGLTQLAADVAEMLPHCSPDGSPVHLVGHSVGGLVVRQAALLAPGMIASLTLYNSGRAPVGERARADIAALRSALASAGPGEVYRMKEAIDAAAGRPAPPDRIAEFLRVRWERTSPGHLLGMAEIALTAEDRTPDLRRAVHSGALPTLVLYGELDEHSWTPQDFTTLAAEIGARHSAIPGAGHSPAVEAPDAFAAALDGFWRAAA